MTRRSGDAYPDFQSVTHQPTGFSRWSLSAVFSRRIRRLVDYCLVQFVLSAHRAMFE